MDLDLKKIEETPHLLDILLEIEDVLDSMDIYVYRNWMLGEVVNGPSIRRYWVSITLKYYEEQMPDPRAGLRLLKHGVMVKFRKAQEEGEAGKGNKNIWLVELEVPRKLINGINDAGTDFYDDEVDVDDIESAKDLGVDDESAYDGTGAAEQ